jgi:hypothetical protein
MTDDTFTGKPLLKNGEAETRITLALCVLVIAGYGLYLWQLTRSGLILASRFRNYLDMLQLLTSLYLIGQLGVAAFAIVEMAVIGWFLRSGSISMKRSCYLFIFVVVSSIVAYVVITHLFHSTYSILGEP